MKYRKKPVVIDAVQWTGKNVDAVKEFAGDDLTLAQSGDLLVATMEGSLRAAPDDWIIKGVKGEFYPCKPDIFAATYELAE